MSGGVDSSVCAHLLVEQGYEVTGVYLECWRAPGCRTDQDRKDALEIALNLGIPFEVLDFKQAYRDKVVEYFFQEYQAGKTPNPDVLCNREIKFGLFYDWAMENGFDAIATGHYAAIQSIEVDGKVQLCLAIPKDTHKDQTYFLYQLSPDQLGQIIFPLAQLTKSEVRAKAKQLKLPNAEKKDSVGICFIGDINVHNFLEERLGRNPGPVIDTDGNVIGNHQGLWFYTIGQRHGFEIDKKTLIQLDDGSSFEKHNIPPFYVIEKRPGQNQLVVGFGAATFKQTFWVTQPHWLVPKLAPSSVRIRHTGQLLPCQIQKHDTFLEVRLEEPTEGLAAGQAAVFYAEYPDRTICLGGGEISLTESTETST